MAIEIKEILSQNITLVYDKLDTRDINTNKLKSLRTGDSDAVVVDTPDTIIAIYSHGAVIVQIAERRIRITVNQSDTEIGNIHLWEMAKSLERLVPSKRSSLIAYGINYDIGIIDEDDLAIQLLIDHFIKDPSQIEQAVDGTLMTVMPRIQYQRQEARCDLVFEALNPRQLKAHLNIHFSSDEMRLPSTTKLRELFLTEYDYFVSLVPKILLAE